MRICFVYQADYPWDVRVEKIARTLTQAGHEVLLVSANELARARAEQREEAHIRRLPALRGRLSAVVNFPAFFNPFWWQAINRGVREQQSDLILVRDLPLALTAVAVGRRHRIPVAMDMAECYPELLRSMWEFSNPGFIKRFTHNPKLGDWVERRALRALDHTFVMVEESRERWLALGADPERVSIVSNTPPLAKFDTARSAARPHEGEALQLLYAGWVTKGRGVDTVIDGLGVFVRQNRTPVKLTVIGDGDGLEDCRQRVWEQGLTGIVDILGWQDNSVVVEHAARANVGLVPHHLCGHWNNTVPNKLFDYMASGLPVLSSNTRPVERILTETGAGLVYQDWNPESFAQALAKLVDPAARQAMAERGQHAVRDHYNWERDGARLLADIEKFATRQSTYEHGVSARGL